MTPVDIRKPTHEERIARATGVKTGAKPAPPAAPAQMPLPAGQRIPVTPAEAAVITQDGTDAPMTPEAAKAFLEAEQAVPDLSGRKTAGPMEIKNLSPEEEEAVKRRAQAALEDYSRQFGQDVQVVVPPRKTADTAPDGPLTAASMTPASCPYCAWDLKRNDVPEPTAEDKIVFVQGLMFRKPFLKTYKACGDAIIMTFRTLTRAESDAIYLQTAIEARSGRIDSEVAYAEKLQRYRLSLQLIDFRVKDPGAPEFQLGDGMSVETNPMAQRPYQFNDPPAGETPLPQIAAHVLDTVLATESNCKVAHAQCSLFNRLVARLEVMENQPDFWQTNAAPS